MKVHRILAACAVLALVGCAKKEEAAKTPESAGAPASPPALTVNGKAISQKTFEAYAEGLARRPFAEISAEDKEQIRENLARVMPEPACLALSAKSGEGLAAWLGWLRGAAAARGPWAEPPAQRP